jgi:quercetin dioxygenase-like cupin family protein
MIGGRDSENRSCDEAMIDETLAESFPASDPPSWTLGREPEAPEPSTYAGGVFAVEPLVREMRAHKAYARDGHTARTLVREPDLRIVLVAMKAGARILEHDAGGTVGVHALEGHIRLRIADERVELPAGRLLVIERGLRHDVEATVDSAFLLTLGWPGAPRLREESARRDPHEP